MLWCVPMNPRAAIRRLLGAEDLNFLLTNRIPRAAFTRFMGWFSKLENPVIAGISIALWRFFCDVDLTESPKMRYRSLHAAFIRPLVPGARPVDTDPAVLASPSDAIVGACGRVENGMALQIKGSAYPVADLLGDPALARDLAGANFVTLRLTAGMYHRFHAPHDLSVEQVRYISGDTWNVNPITLKRIEKLFCKNERAPIVARLAHGGDAIVMVPVAAVLVASIRLPFLDGVCDVRTGGERVETCSAAFAKGAQMGWFEHGSTIVMFAPPHWRLCDAILPGQRIKMGQALLRRAPGGSPG